VSILQELRASFEQGQAYAEIRSAKDAVVRAFQVGVPAVVAWNLPITWYWRLVAFFVMFKLVAIVVTTRRARRERLMLAQMARGIWAEEMEGWLRQNPQATKDDRLAEAGRLLDKFGLRATADATTELQITPVEFEDMYLKRRDLGPEGDEIVDLLVRAGIGVGKYAQYPKPPVFWRKSAKAANELREWLRQNPTASPEARQAKARAVVDINRLVHRSLRMS